MSSDYGLKSDAYYAFEDAINNAAENMRSHGWREPLVALIGSEVDTDGKDFIVTAYGTISLHVQTAIHPQAIQLMTETAYQDMLKDPRYQLN